jgi:uncharacterized membrane protein
MWVSFSRPLYLLLIPAAGVLLWWSGRATYADLTGGRKWAAWVLRSTIVLALLLALAGAQLVKQSKELLVVFAVDGSVSVPPEERSRGIEFVRSALSSRRADQRGALVVFAREAAVESENLPRDGKLEVASRPNTGHTDIAGALRLALGLIPPEAAGRVVLLSDGNENVGSAADEGLLAQANRVPVDVVPLGTRRARDVLVREVRVPSHARIGEPVPVSVTVEATEPAQATLTVLVDDRPVEKRSVTVAAGSAALKVPVTLADSGFHEVEVLLDSPGEECRENDRGAAFVRVKGEPRLLLLDSDPSGAKLLADRLRTQEIAVDAAGLAAIPTNPADLERYDAVYLSDVPAYAMGDYQMAMMRDATRDRGIGLGMIGGEYSFGAGGYYRTPIEEALPVDMDATKDRMLPGASVLLVIDTSGSMGEIEDGREKIELAAEAACAVVDLLQPYDKVGVIASDPRPTSVCDLRALDNKNSVKRDTRSVRAGGGGIACFPSLSAAYQELQDAKTPIRHIIMLADGSDCDEQAGCVPLAAQMAREKITLTTIAFGDGPHVPFLKEVAQAGRGKFYLTEAARDLKKIFTRETLTIAKSVLIEEPFRISVAESTTPITGIDWSSAPPLLGYVATSPKSLANVPLVSHKDDPVFAHWQYGLGRSISFTSDAKARWAAPWLGWEGFSQFWGQTVRWSLRDLTSDVLYPKIEGNGDRARVVVDAVAADGSLINGLAMRAAVSGPDGRREEIEIPQTAPGRYEGEFEASDSGAYVLGISATGPGRFSAHQTAGFSVGYPPDFAETEPQEALLKGLAEQTGGRVLARPEDAFAPPAVTPRVPLDIWRSLLWLAAVLLPFDVAVRRLVIRREDLSAFGGFTHPLANALARLRRRSPRELAREEHIERLLERKKRLRLGHGAAVAASPGTMRPPRRAPVQDPDGALQGPEGQARRGASSERGSPGSEPPPVTAPEPAQEQAPAAPSASTTDHLLRLKRRRKKD